MKPVSSTCAVSETMHESCVWDAGAVLITRQSWGYWKLLGFGVRGPGCGAPSRFLNVHKYLPWIDEIISRKPSEDFEDDEAEDTKKFALRRLSPVELIMYPASKVKTKEFGQCERGDRGHVLYKDSTELLVSKNFAQGFFFVVVSQIAQFTCMSVILDVTDRTNAEMWIEHYCHPDIAGLAHGVGDQLHRTDDYKKLECFVYFKSAAFIEFRFYFSFKALLEVTLFGTEEIPRRMPVPYFTDITTDSWWPTAEIIRWGSFVPYYMWWYWL
uniref:Peptidase S1 domain-containing protein n=3 Tax=Bombyx TaxID=7090 RepID=A0A8R2DKE4_BOMMO|nr:uncharacterized protein LOC110384825 [Bombyx mori]